MTTSYRQPDQQQFLNAVEDAFAYLLTDFSFHWEPATRGGFSIALNNRKLRVVIEGRDWGLNARVALGSAEPFGVFENYDLEDLIELRGGGGEQPVKGSVARGSTQLAQISYYARELRVLGEDLLRGDLSVFPTLKQIVENRKRLVDATEQDRD